MPSAYSLFHAVRQRIDLQFDIRGHFWNADERDILFYWLNKLSISDPDSAGKFSTQKVCYSFGFEFQDPQQQMWGEFEKMPHCLSCLANAKGVGFEREIVC